MPAVDMELSCPSTAWLPAPCAAEAPGAVLGYVVPGTHTVNTRVGLGFVVGDEERGDG